MTGERTGALVGGVEHHAVEAGIGAAMDQIEIGLPVGKADGDETDALARRGAKRRKRRCGVAGEDAELDDVDAGLGHGANRGKDRRRGERQIADRGTGRPPSRNRRQRGAEHPLGQPPQRACFRLLQIDDVGAAGDGGQRLHRRADACQQLRHAVSPFRAAS